MHAVLGMLYRTLWFCIVQNGGDAHQSEIVEWFKRHEGWPLMDGTQGIRVVTFDTIEFDHRPKIEEVPVPKCVSEGGLV